MTNKMTETRYRSLWLNCHAGICLACGAVKEYDCVPDAEGYECDECGAHQVQGLENALLCGNIELTEGEPQEAV